MVADRNEDLDVIGIADDELEAAVQVFYVRRGRVVGRKGFIVDKVEDLTPGRAGRPRSSRASTATSRRSACPSRCWCRPSSADPELYEEWLTEQRGASVDDPGAPAGRQARAARDGHPATPRRSSPATACAGRPTTTAGPGPSTSCRTRSSLPEAPLRIECYDMSHIQGTDYVGSMVVLEDGLPKKREYRRFKVQDGRRQRRLRGHGGGAHPPPHRLPGRARRSRSAERAASSPTRRSCCWSTAARASSAWPCGCSRSSASTTRSRSRRWPSGSRRSTCPGRAEPVRIPRQSEALYLLQRIRDEAHRFAITYHRELRGKRMTKSVLDDIPGLGPTRKKRLLKELGGVTGGARRPTLEELQALPWLPDAVADGGVRARSTAPPAQRRRERAG